MFRKGLTCSRTYVLVTYSLPSFLYINVIYIYVLLVQLSDGLMLSCGFAQMKQNGRNTFCIQKITLSMKWKPSMSHFWHLLFTLVIQSCGTSHNRILCKKSSTGKAGNWFILGGVNWEHCHQVTYQNLCDLLFCLQKRKISSCPYDVLILL